MYRKSGNTDMYHTEPDRDGFSDSNQDLLRRFEALERKFNELFNMRTQRINPLRSSQRPSDREIPNVVQGKMHKIVD